MRFFVLALFAVVFLGCTQPSVSPTVAPSVLATPTLLPSVLATTTPTSTPVPSVVVQKEFFTIDAPVGGSLVEGPNVTVRLSSKNFKIGEVGGKNVDGEGHFHFFVDGGNYYPVNSFEYVLLNLSNGVHSLKVDFTQNDHSPFRLLDSTVDPSSVKIISFNVTGGLIASPTPLPTSTPIVVSPSPVASATPSPSAEVKEFNVTVARFFFSPSTVNVKKGDKVRLVLNTTDITHGISIPDFNVDETLPVGVKTVEFTATKSGTFPFRCSISCGSGHGSMVGQVVVTE